MSVKINKGNRRIIGFAGRKRCGKSFLSETICEYHKTTDGRPVVIATIATALKELCAELLGMSVEEMLAIKDNGTTFNVVIDDKWINKIHDVTGISILNIKSVVEHKNIIHDVRETLQFIGTDIIRKFYPDFHIDQTIKKIKESPDNAVVILDDVRFPNEISPLAELDSEVFFIVRPSCLDVSNHASDTSLRWQMFPFENVLGNISDAKTFADGFMEYYTKGVRNEKAFVCKQDVCGSGNGDPMFGYTETITNLDKEVVDAIIDENKYLIGKYTEGVLDFESRWLLDSSIVEKVISAQSLDDIQEISPICNPLIIENLKMYMS